MKRKVLHISMLLLLPAALMAQSPAGTSAPKLTSAYVKMLGYKGQSFKAADAATWTLKNGVPVYSTYPYGKNIRGYMGPTPLFIAVDKTGKISNIVAAKNQESPEFFVYVKPLLKAWNGKTLREAAHFKPDAVSGATFSSDAIIKTVNATASKLSK